MVSPWSRRARRLDQHALLASTLALTAIALGALPAHTTDQAAPNLILHDDFEGDLSGGGIAARSPSRLNGTLTNPGSATIASGADGGQALSLPGGVTASAITPYATIPNGLFRGRA
ncbi:hypothetical protein ETD86_02610 [Nonomuraea turkmeniaca]|uniref:Uncharacterized protein n=1 Tax=Nonomuraea turkmeniaca TaxID=103838 RepID=A0A5S4FW41_9ACTN|nr:hypothetical protein [Nonomuraea turkmeniaca]TMR25025.1 hypothetical protein ETD86_02610 [Nonomuraea turkmeniaca]